MAVVWQITGLSREICERRARAIKERTIAVVGMHWHELESILKSFGYGIFVPPQETYDAIFGKPLLDPAVQVVLRARSPLVCIIRHPRIFPHQTHAILVCGQRYRDNEHPRWTRITDLKGWILEDLFQPRKP